MRKIVGFVGSAQRPSKTFGLTASVVADVAAGDNATTKVFDLLDLGDSLFSLSRNEMEPEAEAILRAVEDADVLVVGSPTYKGSYSGLFKHVFDLIDPHALRGKPVGLIATGGGYRHALAIEHHMRPLFGFFGALTMPTSVYAAAADFSDASFSNIEIEERVRSLVAELKQAYPLSSRLPPSRSIRSAVA